MGFLQITQGQVRTAQGQPARSFGIPALTGDFYIKAIQLAANFVFHGLHVMGRQRVHPGQQRFKAFGFQGKALGGPGLGIASHHRHGAESAHEEQRCGGGPHHAGKQAMAFHPLFHPPRTRQRPRGNGLAIQIVIQVITHGLGRVVAIRRILLQRLEDDDVQIQGQVWHQRARPWGFSFRGLAQDVQGLIAFERRPATDELKAGNTQRVDIRAAVQGLSSRLFGAHVLRGSNRLARLGQSRAFGHPGQSKIQHQRLPFPFGSLFNHHVARFQVPVDDAQPMRRVDALAHLRHDPHFLL